MPHLLRVEKMVIHDHEKVSFLPVFVKLVLLPKSGSHEGDPIF